MEWTLNDFNKKGFWVLSSIKLSTRQCIKYCMIHCIRHGLILQEWINDEQIFVEPFGKYLYNLSFFDCTAIPLGAMPITTYGRLQLGHLFITFIYLLFVHHIRHSSNSLVMHAWEVTICSTPLQLNLMSYTAGAHINTLRCFPQCKLVYPNRGERSAASAYLHSQLRYSGTSLIGRYLMGNFHRTEAHLIVELSCISGALLGG